MAQTILEMATELTTSLIQAGEILPEHLQDALQKTYDHLMTLHAQEKTNGTGSVWTITEPVNWRKSIRKHAVTCLECGAAYKQLSRHLAEHHLDARSYRSKYGIPRSQPLVARAVTARRKTIAQQVRPWEKAPGYMKAHGVKATKVRKRTVRVKV